VRGEIGGVMVVDDRRRAGVGELLGDSGSEAARTAGNKGNAPRSGLGDFASGSVVLAFVCMLICSAEEV
jgi:hypothetical protein